MGKYRDGVGVARHHAWAQFGRQYWRWFVFGPIIIRTIAALVTSVGLAFSGMYVWDHAAEWAALLGEYLALVIFFGVSFAAYSVSVFIIWRVWGWYWQMYGITTIRYTVGCTTFAIVIGFLIGLITI